ncbi:MAG TPA: hypothetical protein VHC00_01620 [Rhizobiaceae bacterium]|nr:hypothetical protein [Rhizobiaceae bacterium]
MRQNGSIQGAPAITAAASASGARYGFTSALFASLAVYAAAALWLTWHPVALSSDDALFFTRALTRFSVLDFSPQFPGYPGFVALGRLALSISHDPLDALGLTTLLITLSLPPMAGLVAWRVTGRRWRALLAFLLTLACPLLPDMALSLLSDASGILFLLVFLTLLPRNRDEELPFFRIFMAGVALAWAGACRPSDAVLLGTALISALVTTPRIWKPLLIGALTVVVPVIAVISALEGTLYLQEGLRFFVGNATLWGNTPFAAKPQHDNWFVAIAALPGDLLLIGSALLSALVAVWRLRTSPATAAAAFALLGHALWIAAFQNPDHLRHLAPIMVLGGLLLAMMRFPDRKQACFPAAALYALAELYCLASTTDFHASRLPPLAAAIAYLREQPKAAIATNNGVFTLRTLLPRNHIYDMHYPADARLGLATAKGPAYRLTTTAPASGDAAMIFPSRFAGEETMWLVPGNRPAD